MEDFFLFRTTLKKLPKRFLSVEKNQFEILGLFCYTAKIIEVVNYA